MQVQLDRQILIEKPTAAQDATYGSAVTAWEYHAKPWAERKDILPSRSEQLRQGIVQNRLQTRFRIRWRDDIDASMRITDGRDVFQIVGGPAEIGRREWLELLCEKPTTTGGAEAAA